MKLTPALRKAINAAVREKTMGSNPLAEVGNRDIGGPGERRISNNALRWPEDSDLFDLDRLATVKTLDDDPAHPGYVELDLYVTTGCGHYRELETNVCILIKDGAVIGATSEGLRIPELKASLNFPAGAGF